MDFSTVMSYLQNQIQHKKLGQVSENHFSVQGLNQPDRKSRELAYGFCQASIEVLFLFRMKGYVSVDVSVMDLNVNQCDGIESPNDIRSLLSTHRCHKFTSKVSPS